MINAFKLAGEQLREIAESSDGTVQVHEEKQHSENYRQFEISIRFDGLKCAVDGLRLRARETFHIIVPHTFPFHYPFVVTPHVRFSGFHHVLWRRFLCLYRSSSDWRPENGMYGFVKKLDSWIRDAAVNHLDPNDAPLHPPVVYATVKRLFVPKVDTPLVANSPWFGFAVLRRKHNRTEIIDWMDKFEEPPAEFAPAILLHEDFPFEYPKTVNALLLELDSHGIDYGRFIIHYLGLYARHSEPGTPLVVVLGTPMRRVEVGGRALQHLAVWEISAEDADKLRELNISVRDSDPEQWTKAKEKVVAWAISAEVGWCEVSEMRPEVTRRRDQLSPMAWFCGKHVAIWGCGAIGTQVAESVVRAGASIVELTDNKTVIPGLLVRQGYEDTDIGKSKARALAERLTRIEPDLEAIPSTDDLIQRITGDFAVPKVDLIIDCTASKTVRTALERALRDSKTRPPIASIAIDSQAAAAIATLALPGYSGVTLDLVRRLKLEACRNPRLSKFLEAFWQREESDIEFQPEPGCSEPTFIGSNADLAGMSARMLNAIARAVASPTEDKLGFGWLSGEAGTVNAYSWLPDYALQEKGQGFSVRICSHAVREMCGWTRRSVRTVGPMIETGGLVFGEMNSAAGVLWVTNVEGPPPDSQAAEDHFTCGTEGMNEISKVKHCMFFGSVDCIGSWHTHPSSKPYPDMF